MKQVNAYIDALPEPLNDVCQEVRELIQTLVPGVEERYSYGMPFYHYFGMFLFLKANPDGIAVTFCRGKDLLDTFPQLQQKERAIMAHVLIRNRADIVQTELHALITTGAAWNKEAKELNIPAVKKRKTK